MSVHIESAGRGRPLVLLHGWAMHSGFWRPLVPRLTDRFRVHMVDLPGHGYSAPVVPYALDALVAAAIEALPEMAGRSLTLLGWSLGGAVAMRWARTEPDRVRALVLTGATPCFVRKADWPHAMSGQTLRQFGDELAVSYWLTLQRFVTLQAPGSDRGRTTLAQLRGYSVERSGPSPAVLRAGLELLAVIDLRSEIAAIHQPALVIVGDRDTLTPPAASRWLASALPNAKLAPIPGAAHAPFLSHPEAFTAALARFTDEH